METAGATAWSIAEIPPLPVRRFSVDEFLRIVQAGIFDEDDRSELLEGWIVPKMTRNPPHEVAIELAHDALRVVVPAGWRVRNQSSVRTRDSVPEPDLAIVRGSPRDHLQRHPGPEDTALAVEVSDSTLAQDRGIKRRLYARAAIPAYWIINLVDRRVEVFSDPTGPAADPAYRAHRDFGPGEAVPLVIEGREVARVAVDDLLP